MAECYECGSYIAAGEGVRREVETGRNSNVSFTSKGLARHSSGKRHGKRTICVACASAQDKAAALQSKILFIGLIAFIAFIFYVSSSEEKKTTSNLIPSEKSETSSAPTQKNCERYNFPCQLNDIIETSDWDKIKSGLVFSAGFQPTPVDMSWNNDKTGNSGFLRYLSINRNDCIFYELKLLTDNNQTFHSLSVCKNSDGTFSLE